MSKVLRLFQECIERSLLYRNTVLVYKWCQYTNYEVKETTGYLKVFLEDDTSHLIDQEFKTLAECSKYLSKLIKQADKKPKQIQPPIPLQEALDLFYRMQDTNLMDNATILISDKDTITLQFMGGRGKAYTDTMVRFKSPTELNDYLTTYQKQFDF